MNTEIKYTGYTASTSDYQSTDGDLSLSINLINEDGAIRPVMPPEHIFTTLPGHRVLITHSVPGQENIIIMSGDRDGQFSLHWLKRTDSIQNTADAQPIQCNDALTRLFSICPIGNTIVVLTAKGMRYLLWDNEKKSYLYLGSSIPELDISFGLRGKVEVVPPEPDTDISTGINYIGVDNVYDEWLDETKQAITASVMAQVNKFIVDKSTNAGRFIFPFFVRYALRLYDGSLTHQSAPVLMLATESETPNVLALSLDKQSGSDNHYSKMRYRVAAVCHQLDYSVISSEALDSLRSTWKDLVKSVDIFISLPIYTFDQSGEITKFIENDINSIRSYCLASDLTEKPYYTAHSTYNLYRKVFYDKIHDDLKPHFNRRVELPRPSDNSSFISKVKSTSHFYFLKSINIDELQSSRTVIDIPDDYLGSLAARETLPDDYDSHDSIVPSNVFPYNSRLNIADISKIHFPGFHVPSALQFSDDLPPSVSGRKKASYTLRFFIKDDGRTIVTSLDDIPFGTLPERLFIYHPSPNAYRAIIYRTLGSQVSKLDLNLNPHDFLAGSYCFNETGSLDWQPLSTGETMLSPTPESSRIVRYPNKIYTSEVNNPFLFPLSGINTIGSGTILALSTAARALSQGQFGQFPLYAFTTEGVWAMEVSDTGSYSAKQPITRDICTNPGAITQIDSAVLFPTARGIMLISGSQTQCISDTISSETPFDISQLPHMNDNILHSFVGADPVNDRLVPMMPFSMFLKGCAMIYDYVHQRIILYNSNVTYAYVYSRMSGHWGMLYSYISYNVPSYPRALAVLYDGSVVDFAGCSNIGSPIDGVLLTRPLKLGAPDILKTVDTVIQRGHFRRGHVQSLLYASRDLDNWHLVWSSSDHFLRGFSGTPYKYFRIACVTSLTQDENLIGASVRFTPRLTNRPR